MASAFGLHALPTGRNGRLLALGIALLGLGLCWAGLAMPLIGWYQQRDAALDRRIAYAAHMAAIAADLPAAQRAATAARSQTMPADLILAGSSDPIAGATLESLIDRLTRDAQATLISTEALPAVQQGAFRRIGLHVTARAPWANLVRLLAAIERADPRMSLGNLQIQAGPLGGAEQLLDMNFAVAAFRAGTAAPSPADAFAPAADESGQ